MLKISQKLIGHNALLDKLNYNISNKLLPHSIIFHGLEGIGKSTFSYFFINNFYMSLTKTTNHISQKNLIYNNSHPNIRILKKEIDLKSKKIRNYITIDQIRNLENFIYQSTIDNLPKFIIIDTADDLNNSSSNALLKILEEPKKNTYFILISNQLSLLIPTIRSRCVKFKFTNPTIDQFKEIINNNIEIQDTDLNILYDISNSSPGLALKLYEDEIYQKFDDLLLAIKKKKLLSSQVVDLSNTVSLYTNSEYRNFLFLFKFIILNMIKTNSGVNIENIFISHISSIIKDLSINFDNLTLLNVLEYLKNNENDLFIFNIDKKNFNLNLFSLLVNS